MATLKELREKLLAELPWHKRAWERFVSVIRKRLFLLEFRIYKWIGKRNGFNDWDEETNQ